MRRDPVFHRNRTRIRQKLRQHVVGIDSVKLVVGREIGPQRNQLALCWDRAGRATYGSPSCLQGGFLTLIMRNPCFNLLATELAMYQLSNRDAEHLAEAQNLAATQLAHLLHPRSGISETEALPFLAREILRLHREGEQNVQRLASRAVSLLREHIHKRESALRMAKPSEPD